jgi:quinol-cytochrome oxidoreductase complex cytochrome b subunit
MTETTSEGAGRPVARACGRRPATSSSTSIRCGCRRRRCASTYTWALGGTATLLVLTLVSTGILLMFRYEPTVDRAYLSIQSLETQVMFGSLVRAVHHWSANLLIRGRLLSISYASSSPALQAGRALNWVVGLGLFALVLIFAFTGYLLPWDQLAYWAVTVGMSLVDYIPLIGGRAVLTAAGRAGNRAGGAEQLLRPARRRAADACW